MRFRLAVLAVLFLAPLASAATFNEDFESFNLGGFNPETKPDQDWYNYVEGADIGNVTDEAPIIEGTQSFRVSSPVDVDTSSRRSDFNLEIPATLSSTTFFIEGVHGSQQVIRIQSASPARTMVEFFLLCHDASLPNGCDLRVRFQQIDSLGVSLIPATNNATQFKIQIVPNWFNSTYQLFVDDIDDGFFPFMELPGNIGRLRIAQVTEQYPMDVVFDDWTVEGAVEGAAESLDSDIATGIQNFLVEINFTTAGSKFVFGLVLFFILMAAVIVPLLALGMDNTTIPSLGVYGSLLVLWLVFMEIWPDWMGITAIIAVSAIISLMVRKGLLGITDAGRGPGLVAGSLGYFIIASSFLGFSGYASEDVELPINAQEAEEEAGNETATLQSWGGAIAECSMKIITFGTKGDCSRKTVSTTWKKITNAASSIFNFARASATFLFQLLTFQLPIPVFFNLLIVMPPAVALATLAIQTIRGVG